MKKRIAMGLVLGALLAQVAAAAEITVLSAGAIQPGLAAAAAVFEKQTGHAVKITYATAPQIAARAGGGEMFDVVIAPPAVLDDLAKVGKAGERVTVGRVGVGVAVRAGAPVPDISSAEALKRSVLSAESLVFNRASTGVYLDTLFKQMGISGQIEGKITRYADGTAVHEHVLKGRGREIGFGAIPDILLHRDEGLRLAGPLPAEVQNYTSYAAAPMTAAPSAEVARIFVRYLGSAAAKSLFTAAGIEP
jgi:molybdate transport system substrate-binding protein